MEHQHPAFGIHSDSAIICSGNLARSDEDYRAFTIVITAASIKDCTAIQLLKEYAVEAKTLDAMLDLLHFSQIYDADKRMKRLHTKYLVVVLNGLHIDYLIYHIIIFYGKDNEKQLYINIHH